jgi:4-hydroxy-3-methylbut-2-enyl diphosphate reductase
MIVKIASKAGFCFGVKRAIELAEDIARENKGPIYTLGPLIHNPQVVASLAEMGISEINDVKYINEGTLVIRSHGVSPEVLDEARDMGINIVDATCPYVRRAQDLAVNSLDRAIW